jgi:anaerobic magnesium-protoporphyrin IX monomethyl ester cyclase
MPDVIGLTCWTVHAPFVIEFVKEYKKRHPEVFLVLGGIHASSSPQTMMDLCPADAIVHSEGEQTFYDLLCALRNFHVLYGVKGITFRDQGQLVTTGKRSLIKPLDAIPFPQYELLKSIAMYQPLNRKYVFSIVGSRGCVHKCAFCSGNKFWGYQRWRSPQNILEEIRRLKSNYDVGFIRFEDDDLLCNKEWAIQLLNLITGEVPAFSCLARFDSVIFSELPELLARAGCTEIYHGLETTSGRLLAILNKRQSILELEQYQEIIGKEVTLGLNPTVSAIIGIPTETESEIYHTVEFLLKLRALGAKTQLWLLTPYPDTEIVEKYKQDLVAIDRWKHFSQFDVFSEAAHEAYGKLIRRYNLIVPDWWMFNNEIGVKKTGEIYTRMQGRVMGVMDFV